MEYLTGERDREAKKWMNEAARAARNALCHKARCGAVVVKDGEVIGEGYNAPPLDKEENRTCGWDFGPGKPKYDRTCCMHAEWRAILDVLRSSPAKVGDSKLYFVRVDAAGRVKKSGEPYCTVCSRLALDAGVGHFLLWQDAGICEYPTHEYNQLSYRFQP